MRPSNRCPFYVCGAEAVRTSRGDAQDGHAASTQQKSAAWTRWATRAQEAGQFGPAVRAEELLGRSIGMWIDRSLQLTGQLNDSHVTALLELARKRQAEPIDLADDRKAENRRRVGDQGPCGNPLRIGE